ncbi:uncharacterized protein V1516DRAFT_667253 [Lipomyces oligophaga]|uniref:uncharacterized protein n=1 Tax=Lipomyces oligophaga TaxID=45792 RepID=UPI0034CDBD5D
MSIISMLKSLKFKYYITIPLYMLTPVEQLVLNTIVFTLLYLLCTAVYMYFPGHAKLIAQRAYYYYAGDSTAIA